MILNQPLMVTPEYAETICAVLGSRIGVDNTGMNVNALPDMGNKAGFSKGTAIIPVMGSMTHRPMGMDVMSGQTSYVALQEEVEQAMSNPEVKSILFDYNSGGGMVAGAFDFRDYLMDQRGRKPMYSLARDTMCSAAYLLGSTADKVFTTQTGQVGSIGVVMTHVDESEKLKQDGRKVTFFQAGAMKTAGNSTQELTDDVKAYIQSGIDDSYGMFINAVQSSRGLSEDSIRSQEARVYRGTGAVEAGLVDGVLSYEETLNELAGSTPRVYSFNKTEKNIKMDKEEADKLMAELATSKTDNEALRAAVLAEGYKISAEGLTKAPVAEFMEIAGEKVDKASLPANVVAALEAAAHDKMDAELTELASKDLPNFAVADAKALLAVAGTDKGMIDALKAADAAMGSLMVENGSKDPQGDMVSAVDKLEALYEDTMEADGISLDAAKQKIQRSPKGMELIKLARKENK